MMVKRVGGSKIENKCTASINRLDIVVLSFDYPVESDLTITWKDLGSPVTMSKGEQSTQCIDWQYSDSNTLQSLIESITPSEDEIYKYTF